MWDSWHLFEGGKSYIDLNPGLFFFFWGGVEVEIGPIIVAITFWFLVTDSLMLGPLQGKYSNISCILCEKKGTSPSKVPAGRGYVTGG